MLVAQNSMNCKSKKILSARDVLLVKVNYNGSIWIMERPTGRCHLITISVHLLKTTKTASVSTFTPWPSLINYLFLSVWSLWRQFVYLGHLKILD